FRSQPNSARRAARTTRGQRAPRTRSGTLSGLGVCHGGCPSELADGRDLRPVGHLQVGERLVLVNALEATDRVPRDRDRVAADQRPVRGVSYTNVRVLPGDYNLVDPKFL